MNEILFIVHILIVIVASLLCLKQGKEALICWIALQGIFANFFVLKQITLFSAHITCSDVFAVGLMLCLNMVREYYGKEAAKKALHISVVSMGLFVILSQVHLWYQASPHDTAHTAYAQLLAPAPRLLVASWVSFFISLQLDLKLLSLFKGPFFIRSGLTVALVHGVDTLLFSLLGLWGLVSHLSHVIVFSLLLKSLLVILMTPLTHFSKRFTAKDL